MQGVAVLGRHTDGGEDGGSLLLGYAGHVGALYVEQSYTKLEVMMTGCQHLQDQRAADEGHLVEPPRHERLQGVQGEEGVLRVAVHHRPVAEVGGVPGQHHDGGVGNDGDTDLGSKIPAESTILAFMVSASTRCMQESVSWSRLVGQPRAAAAFSANL